MAAIPKALQEHINTAYPAHVCLVGTTLPDGYAQITPRGSTMVYDDEHFALWERGKGSTTGHLADGTKVTIYFRKPPLRELGLLPRGGIARFYGTARIYKSGPVYEEILETPDRAGEEKRSGQEGLRRADQGGAGGGPGRRAARDLSCTRAQSTGDWLLYTTRTIDPVVLRASMSAWARGASRRS